MCEFCHKHGEGEKWYLQAKNYSDDLTADIRRQKTIEGIFEYFDKGLAKDAEEMDTKFAKLPATVKRIVGSLTTRRFKRNHFGQVVPIEDVEAILHMMNGIVRSACVCRKATTGREARYCFGLSLNPNGNVMTGPLHPDFQKGPEFSGVEVLSTDEALDFMRGLEGDGAFHSIWTFGTPFIGGLCNCDRSDCVAMRATVKHGVQMMFKAEYVAQVDPDLCSGCQECLRLCQFGAMGFSSATRKAYIDQLKCYGCGVCRSACPNDAISLVERKSVPVVAESW